MRIVFSPHIDDAFLSLGGSILSWIGNGEIVRVINIFSKCKATKWGAGDPHIITALRKREEKEIGKATGVCLTFLDIGEAPLRGYARRSGKFQYPHKVDWRRDKKVLIHLRLAATKFIQSKVAYYFPLAVGNHTDHLLVRELGKQLIRDRDLTNASFYEDIPYVGWFPTPQGFIRTMHLNPRRVRINLNRKVKTVSKYRSQLENGWVEILKRRAQSFGGGRSYEQFWQTSEFKAESHGLCR